MCLACLTTSKRAYITTWETKDKKPIPAYQKLPYIVSGYRVHYTRFWDCLMSMFQWHNETVNVWTAFLPLLFFIWQTAQVYLHYYGLEFKEKLILTIYCLSACSSFLTSSVFHLFNCMGESVALFTLRLDMLGIAFLIGGSYLPALYYAFYCDASVCRIYTSIISVLTLCASIMFAIPKFANGFRWFRIMTFAGIAAFGVVVVTHVLSIRGDEPGIVRQINLIFLMYGMYGAGVVFYATLVPEAYAPVGSMDLIVHSHNIWHLFVFLGAFVHNWNIFEMIESGPKCAL
eukprot:CAMPEP_0117438554 /NCGR_PEP_ID=MMETSP0759-20121206/2112_1 /TAXON_ID=63605 /ORGANISM="Percolomonas cosmopolitus, Strain WS" /LENGTH=287 /DNA_ID=CAMNT_0005230247 /DNA_START=344 /DNA_END=1203 /DNA_ORIENTATION=+